MGMRKKYLVSQKQTNRLLSTLWHGLNFLLLTHQNQAKFIKKWPLVGIMVRALEHGVIPDGKPETKADNQSVFLFTRHQAGVQLTNSGGNGVDGTASSRAPSAGRTYPHWQSQGMESCPRSSAPTRTRQMT